MHKVKSSESTSKDHLSKVRESHWKHTLGAVAEEGTLGV